MKNWKFLLIVFISLVLVKSLLSSLVPAPSMFSDEYDYAKMARSFWHEQNFEIDGKIRDTFPPLYSIIISPSYIFENMRIVYFVIKIINAILSSIIILPAYLLAREFASPKKSLLAALVVGVLPATFSYSPYLMSENLFVTLTLFAIYALYKSLTKKSYWMNVLTGLLVGLAYLTKISGLTLLVTAALTSLISIIKDKSQIKYKLILFTTAFITISSLILRNLFNKTSALNGYYLHFSAHTSNIQLLASFLFWIIIYLGYLALVSGIKPMINMLNWGGSTTKNERTFLIVLGVLIFSTVLIATKHNTGGLVLNETIFGWLTGRTIGRYIDYALPAIVVGGLILPASKRINKKITGIIIALCIITLTFLSAYKFFPINNSSLSILGIASIIYEKIAGRIILLSPNHFIFTILIAGILILIISSIIKNPKTFPSLIIGLFLLTNAINYAFAIENAKTYWQDGAQMQLGLWINDHQEFKDKTFLIDERDEGPIRKDNQNVLYEKDAATIIGFWLNNPIRISSTNNLKDVDYVISMHKLDLPLIKQTNNGIYLYKAIKETKK